MRMAPGERGGAIRNMVLSLSHTRHPDSHLRMALRVTGDAIRNVGPDFFSDTPTVMSL